MSRALVLGALVAGCTLAASLLLGEVLGSAGGSISSSATIRVEATLPVAPVGDILGAVVNENYWSMGDPVHPDWFDDHLGRTVEAVGRLAPINGRKFAVRFGHTPTDGSWGKDGYHWLDALDPEGWDTSIDEFLDYVKLVEGEPYVGVNFGSGTADEAAGMVAYTNGTDPSNPFVGKRIARGRAEPYQVRHWIIGFEQYAPWETGHLGDRAYDYANPEAINGGDPAWHGRPSSNPADFAARAAEYARKMRAASPIPIRVYVPINNWDLAYWGGPDASSAAVLKPLVGLVDGVSVHFYPSNPGYGETNEDLLGRPDTLGERLDLLQALLYRYGGRDQKLEVVDVEYNNRSSSNGQTHQLVNGLFVADTLRVLATKGVTSAFYFAISAPEGSSSGFTYFEKGDVDRVTPTYLATYLVAQNLGSEVVKSEASRSKLVTAPGGTTGAFSYPSLSTLASLAPDRKTLYLLVINKHLLHDQAAEVKLDGVRVNGKVRTMLLTGSSAGATAGETRLEESEIAVGSAFSYLFPAHSVTGMRIPLAAPIP